jgi:hypothetical protein
LASYFLYIEAEEKYLPKTNTENKTRLILKILALNGSMSGEDIAKQLFLRFESRMATAGVIALLGRVKAIELCQNPMESRAQERAFSNQR